MTNSPARKPPASMSSSARRLRQEPFDEHSARMKCHWRARFRPVQIRVFRPLVLYTALHERKVSVRFCVRLHIQPRVRALIVDGTLVSTFSYSFHHVFLSSSACHPLAHTVDIVRVWLRMFPWFLVRRFTAVYSGTAFLSRGCALQVCERLQRQLVTSTPASFLSGIKADPPDANRTSHRCVTIFMWNQLSTRVSLATR